jgi:hypothetical protein
MEIFDELIVSNLILYFNIVLISNSIYKYKIDSTYNCNVKNVCIFTLEISILQLQLFY